MDEVWTALRRNYWIVIGITLLTVALAALYTSRQEPVYESTTTVRISESQSASGLLSGMSPFGDQRGARLETDIVMMRSRAITEVVVDSLALHVQVITPGVSRRQVFNRITAPRNAETGIYQIEKAPGGTYLLRREVDGDAEGPLRRVAVNELVTVGNVAVVLSPAIADIKEDVIRFAIRPFRSTVEGVRGQIVVVRPDLVAQVVSIRYRSTDSVLAASVPNALTAAFIQNRRTSNRARSNSTVGFLRTQVLGYETELRDAESRLRGFREQQRVVSLPDQATEQVRRLAALQAQREQVRSDQEVLRQLIGRTRAGDGTGYRELTSFPAFLTNPSLQAIVQSLTAAEDQRSQLLVRRTASNEEVQALDARIRQLQGQILAAGQAYKEGLDTQLVSLDRTLSAFDSQMGQVPAREIEFARLSRQQNLLEEIYTLLQTRLKEAEIQEAVELGDVGVIDAALVPETPILPRPSRNLVVGLLLGLMFGTGAAFAKSALDTTIRTREDAEAAVSGLTILGAIPEFPAAGRASGSRLQGGANAPPTNRLVTQHDPISPVSEAYRALRTNITFATSAGLPQVIVVTSAMPGDGKSTSSSNLAVTLAQQGVRTLIVDGDLRRGLLHDVFGTRQHPGLTHLLVGSNTSFDDAVLELEPSGAGIPLHFLPSGHFPPLPSELLGSDRMKSLVTEMRARYDVIIFDAPPVNLVTDAVILGTVADSIIVVARFGSTDRRALQRATVQLRQVGAPVSGILLNGITIPTREYSYYGNGPSETPRSIGSNGANGPKTDRGRTASVGSDESRG